MAEALSTHSSRAAALQAALALVALPLIAFAPPAHGRTLLVPVDGQPIDATPLNELLLQPVGVGPLPGSVVVDGVGRGLAGTLFQRGIIMVAAPAGLCSDGTRRGSMRK